MNFDLQTISFPIVILSLLLALPSCVDQDFDGPPTTGTELGIEANTTIEELKTLYLGKPTIIDQGVIIRGVVVADDRSGNFFRSFIFQDTTAGIEVLINLTDFYNFYPIGRELAIACEGLILQNDNGIIQLGGYIYQEGGVSQVGAIVDFEDRILRGMLIGSPEPEVRTLTGLGPDDISTLIKLEDVEFASSELELTFADAFGMRTLNRTIQDCNGNTIVLRTSGFADFANDTLPEGNGSVVAVYNVFGSTGQLFIRGLSDLNMSKTRCSGGVGEEELMSIAEVRELFNNGAAQGPADRKIRGVVISDNASGNFDGRNMILQDATGGIVVRFANDHNFALGEEVDVVVSGQELSEFRELLQLSWVPNELAKSNGAGTLPAPRQATVKELLDKQDAWESTLVQIKDASITGGATFSGGTTVSDETGAIDLFTDFEAGFAEEPLPAGVVTLTAILSQFDAPQLVMRNISDVSGGGGGGDPQLISLAEVRALFEGGSSNAPAARKVRGVVVSDQDNGNWNARNMALQDASGGIIIRFTADHSFALGEEVEINISGQELSEFNGLLQLNNVSNTLALSFGNGMLPSPREATIQEIIDNLEQWESTLVKIVDVEFMESGPFAGEKTLNDGTATISTFIRNDASFANSDVPAGAFTLTAVVSQFDAPQLTIRNLSDIQQ